jgi:hypothetical protein
MQKPGIRIVYGFRSDAYMRRVEKGKFQIALEQRSSGAEIWRFLVYVANKLTLQ